MFSTKASATQNIADHFGFKDIEILKLNWSLSRPVISDLNNDQLNDIIVVNNRQSKIELLLQKTPYDKFDILALPTNAKDINDLYDEGESWRFKRVPYYLYDKVNSFIAADINNDEFCDMIFSTKEGLSIVLQNKPKRTTTTETNSIAIPTWSNTETFEIPYIFLNSYALAIGHLNGDTRIDIAVLTHQGFSILYQNNDGKFDKPKHFDATIPKQAGLEILDLNQDSRDDIIILEANSKFPVISCYQQPNHQLGPFHKYESTYANNLSFEKLNASSIKEYFCTISSKNGQFKIYDFLPNRKKAFPKIIEFPLPNTTSSQLRDSVICDINGDHVDDIVVTDPGRAAFYYYAGNKKNGLQNAVRFPGFKEMSTILAADITDNRRDELIVLSQKEKLIGISSYKNKRLHFPSFVNITDDPIIMTLADINRDKTKDLIYVSYNAASDDNAYTLRTILNIGRKNAKDGPEIVLDITDAPLSIMVADIDRNGHQDFLLTQPYEPLLLIRQAKKDNYIIQISEGINSGLVSNLSPSEITISKNKPKHHTLLIAQKNFVRSLYFNDNGGWQVVDQYPCDKSNTVLSSLAMIDHKGAKLAMFDSFNSQLLLFKKPSINEPYTLCNEVKIEDIRPKRILAGNFGPGNGSHIVIADSTKLSVVAVDSHDHYFKEIATFETKIKNGRLGDFAVADMNNDGHTEIVLSEYLNNHVEIITFNKDEKLISAYAFQVFESPRSSNEDKSAEPKYVTLGDVTGDGLTDLIINVHDRLIIYPQDAK